MKARMKCSHSGTLVCILQQWVLLLLSCSLYCFFFFDPSNHKHFQWTLWTCSHPLLMISNDTHNKVTRKCTSHKTHCCSMFREQRNTMKLVIFSIIPSCPGSEWMGMEVDGMQWLPHWSTLMWYMKHMLEVVACGCNLNKGCHKLCKQNRVNLTCTTCLYI